jgi:hypothetical protein
MGVDQGTRRGLAGAVARVLRREKHGPKGASRCRQPPGQVDQRTWPLFPTPSIKRCLDATVQAADRLDDWIRQYVVEHPLRYRPTEFLADQPQPAGRQKPFPPFSRVSAPHAVGRSRMQAPPRNGLVLARNRSAWLSAIGNSLKAEYDAAATPLPRHLAALVKQLETQEQG